MPTKPLKSTKGRSNSSPELHLNCNSEEEQQEMLKILEDLQRRSNTSSSSQSFDSQILNGNNSAKAGPSSSASAVSPKGSPSQQRTNNCAVPDTPSSNSISVVSSPSSTPSSPKHKQCDNDDHGNKDSSLLRGINRMATAVTSKLRNRDRTKKYTVNSASCDSGDCALAHAKCKKQQRSKSFSGRILRRLKSKEMPRQEASPSSTEESDSENSTSCGASSCRKKTKKQFKGKSNSKSPSPKHKVAKNSNCDILKKNIHKYPVESNEDIEREKRERSIGAGLDVQQEEVDSPPQETFAEIMSRQNQRSPQPVSLVRSVQPSVDSAIPAQYAEYHYIPTSQAQSTQPHNAHTTQNIYAQYFAPNGQATQKTVHTQIDYMHCLVPDQWGIVHAPYYWGKIDRYEADRLLENKTEGTFLLRDSSQDEFVFSVSFRRYGRTLHARIEQWDHRFTFDAHDSGVFSSATICGLLKHYKNPEFCMFFEPMLTVPLLKKNPESLQDFCRAIICTNIYYDGITCLNLPKPMKEFLREYHYKQRLRVRKMEVDVDQIPYFAKSGVVTNTCLSSCPSTVLL